MQVILTDISKPIRCQDMPDGTISLHELRVTPGWTFPSFRAIFSYERAGEKHVVPVVMGKTYTLHDLELLVNKHLNVKEQVALLYYNNGRVTFKIYPNVKTTNINLSDGIKELLKLTTTETFDGITTGQPVDKASIQFTFSDALTIFLTCDECDKQTLVNSKKTSVITALPVAAALDGSFTASLTHPAFVTFKDNYTNHFTFRMQDKDANNLPVKEVLIRLSINERLQRKNISRDTADCAARR